MKLESPEGIANCEEICAVPGLGFAEIGPGDLSLSLGYRTVPREPFPPEMREARERVLAACRKNGVAFLQACSPDDVIAKIDQGVRVVRRPQRAGRQKGQGLSEAEDAGVKPRDNKRRKPPCRQPISSSAPPSPIPSKRAAFDAWYSREHLPDAVKTFGAQKGWRFWSAIDPSLHQAMYQFTDLAALERATGGEEIKRLVADFERDWPGVTRTREVLVLAEELAGT